MNFIQVSEGQLISVYFACLAWLNSPVSIEEKNDLLQKALMLKILDSNQPLTIFQSGLIEFDNALMDYARAMELRVRAIDPANISTGSEVLDSALKERIKRLVDANFGSAIEPVIEVP